jgi:6-pyruvoyltetrahydropterin/6-carboxytetrahydropterin synthase
MKAWTTAQCSFDAARQLGAAPTPWGHGFTVQVAAALPTAWAPYTGGEVAELQRRLKAVVAPLHNRLLNDTLPEPDDAALARWINQRLALPGPARTSVQRNAHEGVHLLPLADGSQQAQTWRRYRFQSAHRLPNVPLGHKCGRMHGHGFEAIVLAAQPAQVIDEAWAPLHMRLNYRCLNDLPGLHNPTSEMLASWLWQHLHAQLPGLQGVTVFETASCGAHVDGSDPNSPKHRIWKDFSFDSATQLRHAPRGSEQAGLHGHTYTLRLHLQAPLDPVLGWAVDFGEVKSRFKPLFEALDHQSLVDPRLERARSDPLHGLADGDCASIALWVCAHALPLLPALNRVDVFETPGCGSLLFKAPLEVPVLPAAPS